MNTNPSAPLGAEQEAKYREVSADWQALASWLMDEPFAAEEERKKASSDLSAIEFTLSSHAPRLLAALDAERAARDEATRWIPVTERLPERDQTFEDEEGDEHTSSSEKLVRYTHEHYDKTGAFLPFHAIAIFDEDDKWRDENGHELKVFEWLDIPASSTTKRSQSAT